MNVPLLVASRRGTLFIFVKFKLKVMGSFFAAIIVAMSLSVATFQVVRNFKYKELTERRHKLLIMVLYVNSALVISDLIAGGDYLYMSMAVDVMLALIPLMLLSSSLWQVSRSINLVRFCVFAMVMLIMYHMLCMCSLAGQIPLEVYRCAVALSAVLFVALSIAGMWFRLREVKAVMQAGTVWASLSVMVDSLYIITVMTELFLLIFLGHKIGRAHV